MAIVSAAILGWSVSGVSQITETLEPEDDSSASGALQALAAALGHNLTPDQLGQLAAADELPAPVRAALADLATSFLQFQTAATVFGASADPEIGQLQASQASLWDAANALGSVLAPSTTSSSWSADSTVHIFSKLHATIGSSVLILLEAELNAEVHSGDDDPVTYDANVDVCVGLPFNVSIPQVLNIDLRAMDNVYTNDYAVSLDSCGDDVYHNNAGGNNLSPACGAAVNPAGFLFDLSGNDEYGDAANPRSCGVNGGGAGGAGFLVDGAGKDVYVAADAGVNGGGFTGVGFLADLGRGDDVYTAGGFGVNGGGYNTGGRGFLLEQAGNDTYSGANLAANGGGVQMGRGFLADLQGNDLYQAGSTGVNGGGASRGSGTLADFRGNDVYVAGAGGSNGGGAGQGVGLLLDASGDDSYTATTLGANGGGAGAGVGLLIDRGGNDSYSDMQGGSGMDTTVTPKGTGAQVDT